LGKNKNILGRQPLVNCSWLLTSASAYARSIRAPSANKIKFIRERCAGSSGWVDLKMVNDLNKIPPLDGTIFGDKE
jgi:hypothetical protein